MGDDEVELLYPDVRMEDGLLERVLVRDLCNEGLDALDGALEVIDGVSFFRRYFFEGKEGFLLLFFYIAYLIAEFTVNASQFSMNGAT